MKTYCKRLVLSNPDIIEKCISDYLHDKYRKNSTIRFISEHSGKERKYIAENYRPGTDFYKQQNRAVAVSMAKNIATRTVKDHIYNTTYGFPVVRYRHIKDGGTGKDRTLGLETVLFRLYEAVAQQTAAPLFHAKLGTYQVASIKGRGQMYGKKAICKWLSQDPEGTKVQIKADVQKCYPSIPHEPLRRFFKRDLRKSPDLLYLLLTFIDIYEEWPDPDSKDCTRGILIGSPVSKDMCNYYLSHAYHYATERLRSTKTRRGKTVSKRLISHIIFYMDDIVMYGSNKKDISKAMKMFSKYMSDVLLLKLKPSWRKFRSQYRDKNDKQRGCILDYMGMRFHGGKVSCKEYFGRQVKHRETWVTMRKRIFLKARRMLRRFEKMVKRKMDIPIRFAKSIVSQFGWFKNTDMVRYRKANKVDSLMRIIRKIISDDAKNKPYKVEKYYKMLRCKCA